MTLGGSTAVTDAAPPEAPTRRDRRRERTRARLLEAGRRLITEKGVAGLRIQEITEGADVALGSFYNHFATKEELVEAVVADSLESLAGKIVGEAGEQDDAAVVVSTAVRRVVRLAYEEPEFARLVVHLSHSEVFVARAVEPYARLALERGMASGRFDVTDPAVTLTAVAGGALALIDAILEGVHGEDADVVYAEGVLRSIGVAVDEARAIAAAPLP
jgi:AcrR family transcriptional regulator